jgi:CubicO group peptidase (beta-lactamase class C family)
MDLLFGDQVHHSTLVGAAIQDGKIKSLDDAVTTYIPQLVDSAYGRRHDPPAPDHELGVKWNEDYADPNADVARAGTRILEPGVNPIVSYMKAVPRAHEPGTTFHYDTGETDPSASWFPTPVGKSLSDYASEKAVADLRHGARCDMAVDVAGPRARRLLSFP